RRRRAHGRGSAAPAAHPRPRTPGPAHHAAERRTVPGDHHGSDAAGAVRCARSGSGGAGARGGRGRRHRQRSPRRPCQAAAHAPGQPPHGSTRDGGGISVTSTESPVVSAARRRATLATGAALLAAGDLVVKIWAAQALSGGRSIDLGLLQLRLAYNPGVAFSLGANLPSWIVLTATALVTAGLAVYAWRAAATATRIVRLGLAAVLAGAIANLL